MSSEFLENEKVSLTKRVWSDPFRPWAHGSHFFLPVLLLISARSTGLAVFRCTIRSISLLRLVGLLLFPTSIWDYAPYWCLGMRTVGMEKGQQGLLDLAWASTMTANSHQWIVHLPPQCLISPDTLKLLLEFWCNPSLSKKLSLKLSRVCQYAAWPYPPCSYPPYLLPTLLVLPQPVEIEIVKTCGSQMWKGTSEVICWFPPWFLNAGDTCIILNSRVRRKKTSQPQDWRNSWGKRLWGRVWDGEKGNEFGKEEGIWTNGWSWCQLELQSWLHLPPANQALLAMQVSPAWGQARIHHMPIPPEHKPHLRKPALLSLILPPALSCPLKRHQSQVLSKNIFCVKIQGLYM